MIANLVEAYPETQMRQDGRYHTRGVEDDQMPRLDECLGLLDSMRIGDGQEDMLTKMGKLSVKSVKQKIRDEDTTLWEDLGEIDEEEFQDDLEEAESILMDAYPKKPIM